MKNFVMVVYGTFLWFTTLISTTHTSAGKTPPFTFRGFTSKRNRHFSILELNYKPFHVLETLFFSLKKLVNTISLLVMIQCFKSSRSNYLHLFLRSTGWIINFCFKKWLDLKYCMYELASWKCLLSTINGTFKKINYHIFHTTEVHA